MRQDSGIIKWGPQGGGVGGLLGRLKHVGSSKNIREPQKDHLNPIDFPYDAESYALLEECGRGVSATVYRAICKPLNQVVAVKLLDLEALESSGLDVIIQEAQTMRSHEHPNLLPLLCSFVDQNSLWMVEPYISNGSVLNIMKYRYPNGLPDETCIAVILQETLQGLEYIHRNGMIHRDVKAGNILIDNDGTVFLADFGVSTRLEQRGSWGGTKQRTTFIGTMCWMAPEVMEQTGYDQSADIWSLGITILELAHGHAPFAKFPPMQVVMMTVQNPPPSLEDGAGDGPAKKKFSRELHDLVTLCLQKDPTKRPTAKDLLEHKFFRKFTTANPKQYLQKHLLHDLPNVVTRVAHMKNGVAGTACQDSREAAVKSQQEYIKGVSGWNFDVAALKAQADLEPMPMLGEGDEEMYDPTAMHAQAMRTDRASSSWTDAPAAASADASMSAYSHGGASQMAQSSQQSYLLPNPEGSEEASGRFKRKPSGEVDRAFNVPFLSAALTNSGEDVSMVHMDQHEASIGSTINANPTLVAQAKATAAQANATAAAMLDDSQRGQLPTHAMQSHAIALDSSQSTGPGDVPPVLLSPSRPLESSLSMDTEARKIVTAGRFRMKSDRNPEEDSNAGGSLHQGIARISAEGQWSAPAAPEASSQPGGDAAALKPFPTQPASILLDPKATEVAANAAADPKRKVGRFVVVEGSQSTDGAAPVASVPLTTSMDGMQSPVEIPGAERDSVAFQAALQQAQARPTAPVDPTMRVSDDHASYDGDAMHSPLDRRSSNASYHTAFRPETESVVTVAPVATKADNGMRGRFQIVDEKGQAPELPRVSSTLFREETARMTAAAGSAHGAVALGGLSPVIADKLQELLEASMIQQEGLRTLMHAVTECHKGKEEPLKELQKHPLLTRRPAAGMASSELIQENLRLQRELEKQAATAEDLKKKLKASKKEVALLTQKLEARKQVTADNQPSLRQVPAPAASDASVSIPPTRPGSPRAVTLTSGLGSGEGGAGVWADSHLQDAHACAHGCVSSPLPKSRDSAEPLSPAPNGQAGLHMDLVTHAMQQLSGIAPHPDAAHGAAPMQATNTQPAWSAS